MNQHHSNALRPLLVAALLCALLLSFTGCAPAKKEAEILTSLQDFSGKTVGYTTGGIHNDLIDSVVTGVNYKTYQDQPGEIAALEKGDIDAISLDLPIAQLLVAQHPEFGLFPQEVMPDQYGLVLQKDSPYTAAFSEAIQAFEADGTLDALKEKWLSGDDAIMVIDWSQYDLTDRGKGVLRYAFENTTPPMGYSGAGGQPAGLEVELVLKIAQRMDMGVELTTTNTTSLLSNLESGKMDVCSGCVSITEERAKSVDFPVSHYQGGLYLVCRGEDLGMAAAEEAPKTLGQAVAVFFQDLGESFEKTFITENRWQLIANGLLVTLRISLLAAVFGTIFGFGLCLVLRSKNKLVSALGRGLCKLIQGIPSLVVLMIIYFVIFASSSISAVNVGTFSFTLIFAVSVAGILDTGIRTVDRGQWEAAAALGFGKTDTFVRIILPPAIRQMLPLYSGEMVSMLKLTSIVGYISIEDLTKASDIIRSRTYEAFFPLITTAVIYFLVAQLMAFAVSRLQRAMEPQHKPRRLPKGVVERDVPAAAPGKQAVAAEELIHIEHLKKEFPNAVPLRDVNTSICRGEVITIIGPSGTGKSTLMRCINRLETPTEGAITVFGQNVCDKRTDLNQIRRRMGMVFQSFNLFGDMTVIENVMLAPTVLKKQPRQEAYERAMELLKAVGMAEKALNYPDELSGGQKQRVAIARTLAMDPEIVLLDEPTSALDPTMVGEVLAVIRQLADQGLTMLIVTHEMKFARDVSTRIFYMDQGVIYEDGTPEQIFEAPQKPLTRAFVQRLKVLPFTITSPNYDFIAMDQALQAFGDRNLLAPRQTETLRRAFEEICATNIIPNSPLDYQLQVTTEYAQATGQLTMDFRWGGARYDPLTEGVELSILLIKAYLKSSAYEYADGENHLTVSV